MNRIDICVYSRDMVQAMQPHYDADHVFISINSNLENANQIRLAVCKRTIGIHKVVFGDVDKITEGIIPPITIEQAREVWRFIGLHIQKIERIIVHCDGGKSRSPGMAGAIGKMLNRSDEEFFRRWTPNMLVYRTMVNAFSDEIPDYDPDEGDSQ